MTAKWVLVAEREDSQSHLKEIVGVGRLCRIEDPAEAEFALVISDGFQGQGLGSYLLKLLLNIARDQKLQRVVATILPCNSPMLHVCRKAGFTIKFQPSNPDCNAELLIKG